MSQFMINLRMRRIEEITKGARYDESRQYKQYQGFKRTWMLRDDEVFDTEYAAWTRLYDRLLELYTERRQAQIKLESELNTIRAIVKATTPVRTKDAAFDRDAAFIEDFVKSMDP